jgi:demethylmenaquinone methyltransferase/2-methoxy-6-polyprenyl-1,4-benzoquinol methylase
MPLIMKTDDKGKRAPAFDHFGILAPIYERVIRPPKIDTLLELLSPKDTHKLLDVGGGTGRCVKQFPDLFAKTVLLDVSHSMLSQATAHSKLFAVQGAAEILPFANNAFDRIMAVDSFHHFRNRKIASRELVRILNPGGRLIIEEPDIRRLVVKFVALGETLLLMRSHFQKPERICQYFEIPGLHVQTHENGTHNFWIVVDKG